MSEPADVHARLAGWRARAEAALERILPSPDDSPQRLHAAMRHAALNGGKRIRPLLAYATGHALGVNDDALDDAALAVELIHCYSLVHDDLPAMDDDTLRRGQPTVHVAYDEATAILAGDALQALAFARIAEAPLAADVRIAMLRALAHASGHAGMCGGQALDIDATGQRIDIGQLQDLHARKTGALLRASVRLGALAANASPAQTNALERYARALGLAFQIKDDLLDIEGDSATLGKTPGKDIQQDKATFPALIGVEASRRRLDELTRAMRAALAELDADTRLLAELARQVVERDR
ncbi:geranyl transferase [Lysobacter pythonis]|uniref:Geranyl transferase n=1 Tax=Solilutibacter pythonis TaxID=2483112 RepID=A0A3M2HTK7_9GAMM|nr:farnesyl diphosphate synthase [Lysobacter pythonis]RMH91153.1 geranyl transferase [Lysobacter pythonis]